MHVAVPRELVKRWLRLLAAALLVCHQGDLAFRANGQSKPGSPCNIGVGFAYASRTLNTDGKIAATTGKLKFGVTNRDCPSGSENYVRVGVAPIDTQGIMIRSWNPSPPVNVTVPRSGFTSEHTMTFSISRNGSTKFMVSIDLCNGIRCEDLQWTLSPNNVETNVVIF